MFCFVFSIQNSPQGTPEGQLQWLMALSLQHRLFMEGSPQYSLIQSWPQWNLSFPFWKIETVPDLTPKAVRIKMEV